MTTERLYKSPRFWKTLGGGIIICSAFAIMMPDLIKYLFSISRLLVLIALIFAVAAMLGTVSTQRLREKMKTEDLTASSALSSEPEATEENL